jgi:hypothetical protein
MNVSLPDDCVNMNVSLPDDCVISVWCHVQQFVSYILSLTYLGRKARIVKTN